MTDEPGFNDFEVAQAQFDRIAELMGLDSVTRTLLRRPMHEHRFQMPVKMDDGRVEIFEGHRVQHNDVRGPAWGGVRFHPMENIDTIRALAMWMSWKTALADLPLGGSMGGVACDPHGLSPTEQERLCRAWIRRSHHLFGPARDIPSRDIMTTAQHMTWMLDEYETVMGEHAPGAITGKTLGAGGSLGRSEATGYGLVYLVREALKTLGIEAGATTASVQGFGTVAQHFIELYHQIGGRVLCASCWSQRDGTSYAFRKEGGIDLGELRSVTSRMGEIDPERATELGYDVVDGDLWLEQEVDILVPAALEHQITANGAQRLKPSVRLLAEGANRPTTPDADAILADREVFVIPDILGNAGGVICSYFEQVQNNSNYYWRLDEILSKLDRQLTTAFVSVSDLSINKGLAMRDACLVIAIDRVASLCRERGWV